DRNLQMAGYQPQALQEAPQIQRTEAENTGADQTFIRSVGKGMGSVGAGAVGLVDLQKGAEIQEALEFTYPTQPAVVASAGQGMGSVGAGAVGLVDQQKGAEIQ